MPYKSKAQQRFMFAAEARHEVPKGTAERWAHHTKNIKALPQHVKHKKRKKAAEFAALLGKLAGDGASNFLSLKPGEQWSPTSGSANLAVNKAPGGGMSTTLGPNIPMANRPALTGMLGGSGPGGFASQMPKTGPMNLKATFSPGRTSLTNVDLARKYLP